MNPRHLALAAITLGALAVPATASALPKGGVYTGTATTPNGVQDRSPAYFRLGADPTKPADARIFYTSTCADDTVLSNFFFYDATDRIVDGKLRRVQRLDDAKLPDGSTIADTATTRLTFTDTRVTGTFRIQTVKTLPDGQKVDCDTGTMRVALRRNGGYGGFLLPQEGPAVLTRPSRSAVRLHLRVGATCKPAGDLARSFVIRAPLSDGRFRRDGELRYTQASNGTKVTLKYVLRGTLARSRATATLRVRATTVRADGSAGPSCDSDELAMTLRRR